MNRSLPGTWRNKERWGDRDAYWSWLLRYASNPTGALKVCDDDTLGDYIPPLLTCNRCGLPILEWEVKSSTVQEHTWYTESRAKKLGVKAYFVRHNGRLGIDIQDGTDRKEASYILIEDLSTGEVTSWCRPECIDPEEELLGWVERRFNEHRCGKNNHNAG